MPPSKKKAAPKAKAPAKTAAKRAPPAKAEPASKRSKTGGAKQAPAAKAKAQRSKPAAKPVAPPSLDHVHKNITNEELLSDLSLTNYLQNSLYPKIKSKKSLDNKTLSVITAVLQHTLANSPSPPQLLSFLDDDAEAELVSDVVLAIIPDPKLLSHLLRTSYTSDEHNTLGTKAERSEATSYEYDISASTEAKHSSFSLNAQASFFATQF